MKYGELLGTLQKGKLDPVYLFVGEEEFLKEEALHTIFKILVDPTTKAFNYDLLYAGETDAATAVDIASSYPMMAQRRLVIFRDVQRCSPKDRKVLLRYVADPAQTSCLVLTGPKADMRKGLYKDLAKYATTVVFWPLFDNEMPAWIRKKVQDGGKGISQGALRVLQNDVGNNLRDLANEIDKLTVYIDERGTIEQDDVETIVGVTKSNSVFDLAGTVSEGKLDDSLRILSSLLEAGESGVGLVSILTRHYVTLTKVHQLHHDGTSSEEIAKRAHIRPFLVRSYIQQIRNVTQGTLGQAFQSLLDADTKLKSSYQNPRLIMELLIFKMCRLSGNV